MKSLFDRLRDIQRRIELGIPDDRRAAVIDLKRLMRKYGLTADDLKNEEKQPYVFKIRNDGEKDLIIQLVGMTLGRQVVEFKSEDGKAFFELTKTQAINVSEIYAYHRAKLKKEVKETLAAVRMAFFIRNGLMNPASEPLEINILLQKLEKEDEVCSKNRNCI